MDKKSEKDIKAHLEAIAGREIDAATARFNFYHPVAANSESDGTVKWRALVFPASYCANATLHDISGTSSTGANGQVVFRLRGLLCNDAVNFTEPINVVATPRAQAPFFVTLDHTLVAPAPNNFANDVEITVCAWDANGKPAANVVFDWRCRVPVEIVIL